MELTSDSALELNAEATATHDPLLGCLAILCEEYKQIFSPHTLLAGLPLSDNCLTPSLFVRAASQAGFDSKIVKRELKGISSLVLPAVLLLKNDHACILNKMEEGKFYITHPETQQGMQEISAAELEEEYSGYAIFVQLRCKFEQRASQYHQEEKKSWFWGTILSCYNIYWQGVLASGLINIFVLATPLFIMNVYDRVVPNNAIETLWVLAIGVVVIIIYDLIVRTLRNYFLDIAGQKIDVILASRILARVLRMQLASKPASAGAFASNIREFDTIREFFTSATLATLVDIPYKQKSSFPRRQESRDSGTGSSVFAEDDSNECIT